MFTFQLIYVDAVRSLDTLEYNPDVKNVCPVFGVAGSGGVVKNVANERF